MFEIKRTQSGYYYIEKDGDCVAGGMNKNDATIRYNELVQMEVGEKFKWRPIADLPQLYTKRRKMFVVRAVTTEGSSGSYITDPYCVWLEDFWGMKFARWPHAFPPTEFMELPE